MIVGGRDFDRSREEIEQAMRGVQPEPIREHFVEMLGTVFPPKQVVAQVTGWERQTFTTMEAQRVLKRLGFVCRRAGELSDGQRGWISDETDAREPTERLAALESALAVAQEAVAGLRRRVMTLETRQ